MRTFANILSIATLVMVVSASTLPASVNKLAVSAGCANARLKSTNTILVGDKKVIQHELSCVSKGGAVARAASTNPISVSGQPFSTSCSNVTGILPPVDEHCATIRDSFEIFAGSGPSSVDIQALTMIVWSFLTCAWMAVNNSPTTAIEMGFKDIEKLAPEAGAACFPPHQPFFPQGWCTGEGGLWAVGASHS